jgi:predicted AAA+ superfamily ATPase
VRLCAGRIGNVFVASNLANEVGVSSKTISAWLSILEQSYIIFLLQPYHSNINKRLIKSPKLYFYDTGLASYLLGISSSVHIARDPLRGALFENMVILELLKSRLNQGMDHNLYYYLDQHKHEVDLLYLDGNNITAIEIKSASTYHPQFIKGLEYIKKILGDNIINGYVIYTGEYQQQINWISLRNYHNLDRLIQASH